MGVSFKVSKTGTRFRPKPPLQSETSVVDDDVSDTSRSSSRAAPRNESNPRMLEVKFWDWSISLCLVADKTWENERGNARKVIENLGLVLCICVRMYISKIELCRVKNELIFFFSFLGSSFSFCFFCVIKWRINYWACFWLPRVYRNEET